MLSFNDAISHKPQLVQCHACDQWFPVEQAHWYEDSSSMVWDDTMTVVPICPSCHADPASWLPTAISPESYLANRKCEATE